MRAVPGLTDFLAEMSKVLTAAEVLPNGIGSGSVRGVTIMADISNSQYAVRHGPRGRTCFHVQ